MEEKELKIRESCPFGMEGALSNCNKNCGLWQKDYSMCTFKVLTYVLKNLVDEMKDTNKLLEELEIHIDQINVRGN